MAQPILANVDLERIRHIEHHVGGAFRTSTLSIGYPARPGAAGMAAALDAVGRQAAGVVRQGYNILISGPVWRRRGRAAIGRGASRRRSLPL